MSATRPLEVGGQVSILTVLRCLTSTYTLTSLTVHALDWPLVGR